MSDLISPGQRIRHYRMLRGMTQKALGIAAGFPPETADIRIAQYESGARTPKHALLCTLAEALGISPSALDMGHWTRANAEFCMLATKGHPKRRSAGVHQVILSHIEEHSKKPEEARRRIVQLVGDLPRVELFAREKADGWDAWGNEVDCDLTIEGYRERSGGDFVVG